MLLNSLSFSAVKSAGPVSDSAFISSIFSSAASTPSAIMFSGSVVSSIPSPAIFGFKRISAAAPSSSVVFLIRIVNAWPITSIYEFTLLAIESEMSTATIGIPGKSSFAV